MYKVVITVLANSDEYSAFWLELCMYVIQHVCHTAQS